MYAGSAIREISACGPAAGEKHLRPAIFRHHRAAAVLAAQTLLAGVSYSVAALVLCEDLGRALAVIRGTLAIVLVVRLATLLCTGMFRRSLRYGSIFDLVTLTNTVLGGTALLAILLPWRLPDRSLTPGLLLVDAAFLELLWCALHLGARVMRSERAAARRDGRRTLIVGAGDAGAMLLRDIAMDRGAPFRPVGILDDDSSKWGRRICGITVRGSTADLCGVAAETQAEEVLVCIPSATAGQMHAILDACRRASLPVRTLPGMAELLRASGAADRSSTRVSRRDLRPPRIEDLLLREEIPVDAEETRRLVGGEVVLVTGAGGSIGSELTRQVAAAGPRKLLLLDKSENGLFYANLEAAEKLGAANVKPFLADLVDRERVRDVLRSERPSIVFHAAAHKHVALIELHPSEGIRNNVLGTRNVAEAASEFGASRFVNISSDKAVNPRNWMGLTKKLAELCVQELATSSTTRFSSVRFGNVAGTTGSVLRLFWERIACGEPLRVTDPRATRFFMSVPEAVHLILRAAALGQGGETFVFEMGEPVNICELARTMLLFSGLQPGRDLAIEFTGLQPGEKVTEELWEERENPVASGSERILVIRGGDPQSPSVLRKIGRMEELIGRRDVAALLEYLCTLFPDFRWGRRDAARFTSPAAAKTMARSAGAA